MMRRVQSFVLPLVDPAFWRARMAVREARAFDRRYVTDTVRRLPVDAMQDVPAEFAAHAVHYEASAIPKFRRAMRAVRRTLGPRVAAFSFVDIGSGKGLVVMLAARLPFREVVGVEMAPELHETAEHNCVRFRAAQQQRLAPIRLVQGDALRCDLPAGDLVVYLYNPFDALILGRFLERLEEVAADGREILIVYVNPLHRARLDAMDRYRSISEDRAFCVFRRAGAATAAAVPAPRSALS
jgi:SAM-dependent methyltransferase